MWDAGPVRVLIVEDERPLAEATAEGLRSDGWVVDLAHDGISGLRMAVNHDYDVVVLDIMLPELNGYDVLKHMRAGADDYVTKPFSARVLAARLSALLRRGDTARPSAYVVGDLELDPTSGRVRRGTTEIALTPREFSLLAHLMRNAGAVQSKANILQHVWESNYPGADNVVEVYIGYLRKKVDVPFGARSIETVRGRGYRVVDTTSG